MSAVTFGQEMEDRPEGYEGPDLTPDGLVLMPQQLGEGVYALMANIPPKDNNGLVFGERAALVVDAGINGGITAQIREHAATLADVPLRWLANTTYHGDHTFGNYAIGDDVTIVSSRGNKASMTSLDYEKSMRAANLRGRMELVEDVQTWRRPDVTFGEFAEIDLGGQTVELWHFGFGQGPGDTIVYVPSTRTAWTGNLVLHPGLLPMLLEAGPELYIATLRKMRDTLEIDKLVAGHGPIADGKAALDMSIDYLELLQRDVVAAVDGGSSREEAVEALPLAEQFVFAGQSPKLDEIQRIMRHCHRLNVVATHKALTQR